MPVVVINSTKEEVYVTAHGCCNSGPYGFTLQPSESKWTPLHSKQSDLRCYFTAAAQLEAVSDEGVIEENLAGGQAVYIESDGGLQFRAVPPEKTFGTTTSELKKHDRFQFNKTFEPTPSNVSPTERANLESLFQDIAEYEVWDELPFGSFGDFLDRLDGECKIEEFTDTPTGERYALYMKWLDGYMLRLSDNRILARVTDTNLNYFSLEGPAPEIQELLPWPKED